MHLQSRWQAIRTSENLAHWLLWAGMLLYSLIFALAAIYKLHSFWQGFDLGTHEQVFWNTAHGRVAEVSMFGATHSYLGVDMIFVELLLAPFYALVQRTETLLVIQVVLAASGALPLYLLARDRMQSPWVGLVGGLIYLAALPVQYTILYEFQIRAVGTVCFLWAFYAYERRSLWRCLLWGLLAVWTRSDAGFALALFGVYALIERRDWRWVMLPMLLGGGWLLICLRILIPLFRPDAGFLYSFLYSWLGNTPLEMLLTLLTRPGYVLVNVLTGEKIRFLIELFGPLLFLPLLRPQLLLLAAPSLLLNMLSLDRIHFSIRYHYQAFVLPFLLIATIYALADLHKRWPRVGRMLLALLVVVTLGSQLVLRTPLIALTTRPRDVARIELANRLVAAIPPEASVAASGSFGPHLARRRTLYNFPGVVAQHADAAIYPPELADQGDMILADRRELDAAAKERLAQMQASGQWATLNDEQDLVLLRRITP